MTWAEFSLISPNTLRISQIYPMCGYFPSFLILAVSSNDTGVQYRERIGRAKRCAGSTNFLETVDAAQIVGAIGNASYTRSNLVRDMGRVLIFDSPSSIKEDFHNTDVYHTQVVFGSLEQPKGENGKLQNRKEKKMPPLDISTSPNTPAPT